MVLIISRAFPVEECSDLSLRLIGEAGVAVDSLDAQPEYDVYGMLSQIFDLAQQHVQDIGIN